LSLVSGCASTPPVKSQAYAKLANHRTFENDLPTVWKGVESALHNFKITKRDPDDVNEMEMKKLTHRKLETDWIYTQSRDKYEEYTVNSSPRKVYLQTRMKYQIECKSMMGGTDVTVETSEEIEKLNKDGTSAGYDKSSNVDPSRSSEMLDKIGNSILSAAP
jgi:hypothetical protein